MTISFPRPLFAAGLAAAALLAGAVPSTPAATKAPKCEQRAGTVVGQASGSGHRLVTNYVRSKADSDAGSFTLFTCRAGSRQVKVLDKSRFSLDSFPRVTAAVFRGDHFAYVQTSESGVAISGRAVLRSLGSGAQLAAVRVCGAEELLLAASGALVIPNGKATQIADAAGYRELGVDGATDVALGGSRLYWSDAAGTAFSQKLVGRPSGTLGPEVDCG